MIRVCAVTAIFMIWYFTILFGYDQLKEDATDILFFCVYFVIGFLMVGFFSLQIISQQASILSKSEHLFDEHWQQA